MQPETQQTQPKQQNENLEHERLTSLVNSMADAVIALDENVNIVLYNAAALNIFDVNNLAVNSPLSDVFQPIDADNQLQDVVAMVHAAQKPITSRDLRLKYADGSTISLYLSIAPVHLGYGKQGQAGYVLLLRDITREKSLEEERDEFISVVSHELRTPITIAEGSISNAMVSVDNRDDLSKIKQALVESHNQVIFLADMINDLSTLSRAERGTLQMSVEFIDVAELLEDLSRSYKPTAEAKHLELITEVDPAAAELRSSRLYVREVLQNFITNAIKYCDEGSVTVKATAYEKGIQFDVIDTGIGISKADQERVYDKFFRSEDFKTRQANGTGLGLYVTMKLMRMLHAEVKLQSELEKGSTFTVSIPNLM